MAFMYFLSHNMHKLITHSKLHAYIFTSSKPDKMNITIPSRKLNKFLFEGTVKQRLPTIVPRRRMGMIELTLHQKDKGKYDTI